MNKKREMKAADSNERTRGRNRRTMVARLAVVLWGACVAFGFVLGGSAGRDGQAALPSDPFAGLDVMSRAELAEKRGGFIDADLGIKLNLGAIIRSTIDGIQVLETVINFAPSGPSVRHIVPAGVTVPGLSLTFLTSNGTPGEPIPLTNGSTPLNDAQPISVDVNGTTFEAPGGLQGVVAQGQGGVVATLSKVNKDQFANIVVSSDPGHTVHQDMNVQLTIEGFSNLQQNIRLNATSVRMFDDLGLSSLNALPD